MSARATLSDVTFISNMATNGNAGALNLVDSSTAESTIVNGVFENNRTTSVSSSGGARGLSISPDGQQIVFERAVYPLDTNGSLWIMNRDGSDLHKLADDAGRPAWGRTPAPLTRRLYLPFLRR